MNEAGVAVSEVTVGGQQTWNSESFPLVLSCGLQDVSMDQTVAWIEASRASLESRLQVHGAILFRGFPPRDAHEFDRFVSAFGVENFPYDESLSNAVRVNFTPRVFSANEAPADVTIYLHHEMAQTPVFPGRLFFFCQKPAETGGATPLCRSDVLHDQMLRECPEFASRCEALGLRYSNLMPSQNDAASGMGRSWQSTFRAADRDEAQERMRDLRYSWEWLPDGCLRATTPVLPAVREVAPGRKVFFNQLIAAFRGWKDSRNDPAKSLTFGDGSPLDRETVLRVAELAESLSFDIPWQQGDVALVDNFLTMHGRRTFTGTRKVLASLADRQTHPVMA